MAQYKVRPEVTAQPLIIEDPWGMGWTFTCLRADTSAFLMMEDPLDDLRMKQQLESLRHAGLASRAKELTDAAPENWDDVVVSWTEAERTAYAEMIALQNASTKAALRAPAPPTADVLRLVRDCHITRNGEVLEYSKVETGYLEELLDSEEEIEGGTDEGMQLGPTLRKYLVAMIRRKTAEQDQEVEKNSGN